MDHKVMFVTKLLILEASAVIVLHPLCKGLKSGQKEPQNQVAEGDDAFHHKIWVRCYGFPILACIWSKKCPHKLSSEFHLHNPQQLGRTFHNFCCFASINVAKLNVTS